MSCLILRPPWAGQTGWAGVWLQASPAAPSQALMNWSRPADLPDCQELVLVVPAPLLSWHEVVLPRLPAPRWRAALEGLLEEHLLSETAQLHLALEPQARAGSTVQVAACDRAWLQHTVAELALAGRAVSRIVPEFTPGPPQIYLIGQPERGWLVACAKQQVLCLPLAHPTHEALRAWPQLENEDPGALHAEPAWAARAEEVFGRPAALVQAADVLRQAARSPWNLAQFELRPHSAPHQRLRRAWLWLWTEPDARALRWGLGLLLLVQVLGLQLMAWQERRAQQALSAHMHTVLRTSFPQVGVVIDPLLQMERETQALARSAGQSSVTDLPRLLAALAGASVRAPKSLEYADGQLRLSGWQPGPAAIEMLQDRLSPQGLGLEGQGDQWTLRLRAPKAQP